MYINVTDSHMHLSDFEKPPANPLDGVEHHLNKHGIAGLTFTIRREVIINANV